MQTDADIAKTKCKRTHSFSSFSQLSLNSLPDIKELKGERPRSKSHQQTEAVAVVSSSGPPSKEGSPAPLHLSKAATQVRRWQPSLTTCWRRSLESLSLI